MSADSPAVDSSSETSPETSADPRVDPPSFGDERDTLLGFLRYHRETLAIKCTGLTAADLARRAVEPSTLSLLGLLRHLAEVERGWFRRTMAGQEAPPYFYDEQDVDGDFDNVAPDSGLVEEAWRVWRAEVAFADAFVAEAPDLDMPSRSEHRLHGAVSLRWVLAHMLEEYARHNGHADLLRERIDGTVGE